MSINKGRIQKMMGSQKNHLQEMLNDLGGIGFGVSVEELSDEEFLALADPSNKSLESAPHSSMFIFDHKGMNTKSLDCACDSLLVHHEKKVAVLTRREPDQGLDRATDSRETYTPEECQTDEESAYNHSSFGLNNY